MQVNLKQLFLEEGKAITVDGILPNTEEELWPGHPIGSPVLVSGKVTNEAGIVAYDYTAQFELHSQCARCCTEVKRKMTCRFHHILVEELSNQGNEEAYIILKDGVLDVDGLAAEDISLELPTKVLCRDDCKGLCPKCGKNWNEGSCNCETKEADPRLAKLKQLLEEKTPKK